MGEGKDEGKNKGSGQEKINLKLEYETWTAIKYKKTWSHIYTAN